MSAKTFVYRMYARFKKAAWIQGDWLSCCHEIGNTLRTEPGGLSHDVDYRRQRLEGMVDSHSPEQPRLW